LLNHENPIIQNKNHSNYLKYIYEIVCIYSYNLVYTNKFIADLQKYFDVKSTIIFYSNLLS